MSFQTIKILQLGYSELSIGNVEEAERLFKRAIENDESSAAWMGLGNTRLEHLAICYAENPANNSKIIQNSFYYFRQARSLNEENEEKIEHLVIDLSFQYLTRFYESIKKLSDEWKEKDRMQNGLIITALLANDNIRRNLGAYAQQNDKEKVFVSLALKSACEVVVELRDATIQFVEFDTDYRNWFISTVANKEHELNWYTMAESEKRKILKEQERAKKPVSSQNYQKKTTNESKTSPWVAIILWIVGILAIIRLIQLIRN